jgi:hypothetical protein
MTSTALRINGDLLKPASVLRLECHGPNSPDGPHAATLEAHTHHAVGTPGSECVDCHMPKIEPEIPGTNVRAHIFRFITPVDTETLGVPNPCNACHSDKSTQWAKNTLKTWTNVSPWRVAN